MAPTQLVLKHFTPWSFPSFLPCSTMAADAVDFEELGLFPLEYFNFFNIAVDEDDEDDAVLGCAEEPFLPEFAEVPFLPVDEVNGSAEEPFLPEFTPPRHSRITSSRRKRCSSCTEGSDFPT